MRKYTSADDKVRNDFQPSAISQSQAEDSERIIQVHGRDDSTGLGHDQTLVSGVVVAPLGAAVSKVSIGSVSNRYQTITV